MHEVVMLTDTHQQCARVCTPVCGVSSSNPKTDTGWKLDWVTIDLWLFPREQAALESNNSHHFTIYLPIYLKSTSTDNKNKTLHKIVKYGLRLKFICFIKNGEWGKLIWPSKCPAAISDNSSHLIWYVTP